MGVSNILRKMATRGATCGAVIVAAGSATRMQGIDKVMASLAGMPVLGHTLKAFQASEDIDQIVVVTRQDLLQQVKLLAAKVGVTKLRAVTPGGATRAESVQAGLKLVKKCSLVAIHDGARPLVTQQVIHDAVRKAAKFGAAAPAIPVKDTVKVASGGVVTDTPDRAALFAVQTPQVFHLAVYQAALTQALAKQLPLTDDCSAAEAYGQTIYLTPGSEENIKITTPMDLTLAQAILAEREKTCG